ncbi:MAG TPA: hypothetical protein VI461_06305, partial [Chitinophagaceae bacterium]|nr:hypothetical protein [Chitinophagaceae bacterium]
MTKIFTRVKKIIVPVFGSTVADKATIIFSKAKISTNNKYFNNDPVMAGSFSFLCIPIFHFNKNLFMETLLHGSKRSILALFLFFAAMLFAGKSFGQGSQIFSSAGTSNFTVPAGVTSITVQCWGGGGG